MYAWNILVGIWNEGVFWAMKGDGKEVGGCRKQSTAIKNVFITIYHNAGHHWKGAIAEPDAMLQVGIGLIEDYYHCCVSPMKNFTYILYTKWREKSMGFIA